MLRQSNQFCLGLTGDLIGTQEVQIIILFCAKPSRITYSTRKLKKKIICTKWVDKCQHLVAINKILLSSCTKSHQTILSTSVFLNCWGAINCNGAEFFKESLISNFLQHQERKGNVNEAEKLLHQALQMSHKENNQQGVTYIYDQVSYNYCCCELIRAGHYHPLTLHGRVIFMVGR